MKTTVKPALPWSVASRIAWRELHASRAKFFFVVLSVAIGVAALTGVRGFSESFQRTLLAEARTIMAADLSARMFRQPTEQEDQRLAELSARGLQQTTVTEMVTMAWLPENPQPLLISLKAVDPARYPFYGAAVLDSGADLKSALTDSSVVVVDDLLVRLHTSVGKTLRIGNKDFRIAAVLAREPDRMSATMSLGPRVMITRAALAQTGLLQAGSRSGERLLFKLPPSASIAQVSKQIERILPDAQVTDFRESNPALTQGLERATALLSLICLVAMVLGAIGVAMAMRAHLQQRIDILAIMKSLGARSSDILRIYLFQTLLLGIAGGLLGVLAGMGVEWIFPAVLGKLLPMRPAFHLPMRSVLAALGTGILTTLLFCLPPLLDIRNVRPSLVLRRAVDGGSEGRPTLWQRVKNSRLQWIATALVLLGLGGIASALSDSFVIGKWFAIGLAAALVVLLTLASITLRVLRIVLSRTRLQLPAALRHGLANLYRPGNQSAAVLAALGTGVMLILTVFLMQKSVVREMKVSASPTTPNVFLIDISTQELDGVRSLLTRQPGVRGQLETLPVVSGRIATVDGVPIDQLKLANFPKRLLQSVALTWADQQPAGVKVLSGKWWNRESSASLAVSERIAQRLHLKVGSHLTLVSGERMLPLQVGAIFKSDGQHVYGRSEFIFQPTDLSGLPVVWYGAVHVDGSQVPAMQRALFAAYPTITVINIADVLDTIQGFVGQINGVIRFLAGFSMLSGVIILASSVASTRFRRIREVVVLKTLGARRGYIIKVFSTEFLVLGLLAGVVGAIFANLLSRILLHRLDVIYRFDLRSGVVAVLLTAILAVGTGWIASIHILGQKPLEVLREE
ncbi:MAG TPA: FtsX-like permease family protein [Acidisarcina sp.]|nr:FtsX-like permease family protein [Acidisarcina sp.]